MSFIKRGKPIRGSGPPTHLCELFVTTRHLVTLLHARIERVSLV
jgi:hypothetical protein